MTWLSQELAENSVATFVDFASIFVAYNLGVLQLGVAVGFVYAAFDAYVVIWMRRRITRSVRRLARLLHPAATRSESEGRKKKEMGKQRC